MGLLQEEGWWNRPKQCSKGAFLAPTCKCDITNPSKPYKIITRVVVYVGMCSVWDLNFQISNSQEAEYSGKSRCIGVKFLPILVWTLASLGVALGHVF